jgi:hypothetical protein
MAKHLKVIPQQEVAPKGELNFFNEYAQVAGTSTTIVGQLLKFSKGDFVAGPDNEPIAIGTKLIANMDALLVGWQRWEDQRPAEQIMGPIAKGFMPPKRDTLSFNDPNEWDVDEGTGKPRDPWVLTHILLLKAPGKKGQLYTFTTNSAGGKKAMAKLCFAYGRDMSEHPDEYPVCKLDSEVYEHTNPAYGRIKNPTFEVVGWAPQTEFAAVRAAIDAAATEAPVTAGRKKIK